MSRTQLQEWIQGIEKQNPKARPSYYQVVYNIACTHDCIPIALSLSLHHPSGLCLTFPLWCHDHDGVHSTSHSRSSGKKYGGLFHPLSLKSRFPRKYFQKRS